MKLSYVVLQIALVGAGILVYDQIRGGENEPAPVIGELESPRAAPEPAPAPEVEVMPPVVLEGRGVEAVVDRLAALEQKVAGLADRTTVVAASGDARRPEVPEEAATGMAEHAADPDLPYSEDEIEWYRGLKRHVDQIERRERYASMINRQLNRAEVDLTQEQRSQIVDATIAFRNKLRDQMRQAQQRGDDRDARQALIERMRNDFEQTVYALVPAADAEQVIESVGRYSGFGTRRGGPSRFNRR